MIFHSYGKPESRQCEDVEVSSTCMLFHLPDLQLHVLNKHSSPSHCTQITAEGWHTFPYKRYLRNGKTMLSFIASLWNVITWPFLAVGKLGNAVPAGRCCVGHCSAKDPRTLALLYRRGHMILQ